MQDNDCCKLSVVFDGSPNLIIRLDKKGTILNINKRISEIIGHKPEEFIGRSFTSLTGFLTHKSIELVLADFEKKIRGIEAGIYEIEAINKDGVPVFLDVISKTLKDETGAFDGGYVFLHDVTEHKRLQAALKESEDNYLSVIESSPDGIGIHCDGKIVFVNRQLVKMLGAERPEEIMAKTVIELVHPDSRADVANRIKIMAESGRPVRMIEEKFVRLDGTAIDVEAGASPISYQGRPAVMVVVHDISERKRNEKTLIDARAQINMILSSMQDIVFMFDSEGILRFCHSPAGSALYLPAQEFIGKNYAQIMPRHVSEALENALKENKNGKTSEIEYPLEIRGVHYIFLAKLSPILSSGSYHGSVAVVRDITELRKHDEQLRTERKKLSQYINICNVIFVVINRDEKVSLVNRAGCEMLGSNEEDIVGKNWFDNFIPEAERSTVKITFNKLMKGQIDPVEEFRNEILRKNGTIRKVLWRNTVLRDENGLITGTLSAGEDITEKMALLDKAQMAVKAKEQFMATISHELRTPLASIKEGISAVLDGVSGNIKKDQRSLLQISKRNVDRLARLINNVLDLQKMDLGQMKFIYEETDIPSLINEIYETMLPMAGKKNLDMTKQVLDGLPQIKADKDKLSQVLANLIGNSIHATEKGSVTISALLEEGNIKLSVTDTGNGIRQADLPKLFLRFSQIKRRFGGTGLGLAICKEIVDAHKGAIWAESQEGQGSTFWISLPAGQKKGVLR